VRAEKEPANVPAAKPYRISDLELASRLSFFLWSSIPDDQLISLATQKRLGSLLESCGRKIIITGRCQVGVHTMI